MEAVVPLSWRGGMRARDAADWTDGRRSLDFVGVQARFHGLKSDGPSALQQTSFKEEAPANASAEGSAAVWVGDESVHQALAPSLP